MDLAHVMNPDKLTTVGWREWAALNDLNIPRIKAKVDTGARTSALHASQIIPVRQDGISRIQFKIHTQQTTNELETVCVADILDQRAVKDSGGHVETRWVIESRITLGLQTWPIEITLTARDDMQFRMLLGRTAMKNRIIVDPSRSYLTGKRSSKPGKSNS